MTATSLGTLHATAWRHILRTLSLGLRAPVRGRHTPTTTTLRDLDDRTLADLGLARSEIGSVEAESHGLAPRTRRRIVARGTV